MRDAQRVWSGTDTVATLRRRLRTEAEMFNFKIVRLDTVGEAPTVRSRFPGALHIRMVHRRCVVYTSVHSLSVHMLYPPRCTPLAVHPSLYTPRCTPLAVHPSLYTPRCTPLSVHPSLYTPRCTPLAIHTPRCTPLIHGVWSNVFPDYQNVVRSVR